MNAEQLRNMNPRELRSTKQHQGILEAIRRADLVLPQVEPGCEGEVGGSDCPLEWYNNRGSWEAVETRKPPEEPAEPAAAGAALQLLNTPDVPDEQGQEQTGTTPQDDPMYWTDERCEQSRGNVHLLQQVII